MPRLEEEDHRREGSLRLQGGPGNVSVPALVKTFLCLSILALHTCHSARSGFSIFTSLALGFFFPVGSVALLGGRQLKQIILFIRPLLLELQGRMKEPERAADAHITSARA